MSFFDYDRIVEELTRLEADISEGEAESSVSEGWLLDCKETVAFLKSEAALLEHRELVRDCESLENRLAKFIVFA